MLEADKKIIIDHFNDRLMRFKLDDPQVVSWNSKESQQIRFNALLGIAKRSVAIASILDVGCGVGDLKGYLYDRIYVARYVGVDINPDMVAATKKKYPLCQFEVRDILDGEWEERFDYVVGSGIFSLEIPDWTKTTWDTIHAMFKLCQIGVAVNFLSSRTPGEKKPDMRYADPSIMFNGAMQVTPKVTLRHDYRPNDFTLYLYR